MKWKTIVIGILLLIVASGCQVTLDPSNPENKALSDLQDRIGQLKILKEEKQLTLEVMRLHLLIAQMQAPAQAPPRQKVEVPELGIEGEFIPLDELPPEKK